jgi:hypothetical protein
MLDKPEFSSQRDIYGIVIVFLENTKAAHIPDARDHRKIIRRFIVRKRQIRPDPRKPIYASTVDLAGVTDTRTPFFEHKTSE